MRLEIGMGVQNNSGEDLCLSPYLDCWLNIRHRLIHAEIMARQGLLHKLSITWRIGGKFGDFEGASGVDRCRYYKAKKMLNCDAVVQFPILVADPDKFSASRGADDFRAIVEFLITHPKLAGDPLYVAYLRTAIEAEVDKAVVA